MYFAKSGDAAIKKANRSETDESIGTAAATDLCWVATRIREWKAAGPTKALQEEELLLFAARVARASSAIHEACIRILRNQYGVSCAVKFNNYESVHSATKRGVFSNSEREAYDAFRVFRNQMSHVINTATAVHSLLSHEGEALKRFADQLEAIGEKIQALMLQEQEKKIVSALENECRSVAPAESGGLKNPL